MCINYSSEVLVLQYSTSTASIRFHKLFVLDQQRLMITFFLQYTPPTAVAEYVHRVGRTARIGGRGNSLIFLTPAETAFINELANHNIRSVD